MESWSGMLEWNEVRFLVVCCPAFSLYMKYYTPNPHMAAIVGILISRLQRHCVIYGVEPFGAVKMDSVLPHFILTVYTVNIMKKGGTAKNSKSDFIPIHYHDFF